MQKRSTRKKRQHYVPQMVLKRFSSNGKQVNVWDLQKRGSYKTSIRDQFQEKHFYEKTEEGFENTLGKLERIAKELFDKIEESGEIPKQNSEDWGLLILWTVMQVQRTDELAGPINQITQEVLHRQLRFLEAEGQIPEGPDGISVKDVEIQIDPQWGRQHAVALAASIANTAADLSAALIQSRNGRIILPDSGAIRFNLIAEEGQMPWAWASIGSGALLPLSNKHAVVLYDPGAYTWEGNSGEKLKVMDEKEQTMLAKTSMLRSARRVVFNTDPGWVEEIASNLHASSNKSKQSAITIPGLIPHLQLMKLAQNTECLSYELPARPTSSVERISRKSTSRPNE